MEKIHLRVVFTEEEKEEYKEYTLQGLREGKTLSTIAEELGVSPDTAKVCKNRLIAEGTITSEEIDEIREKKRIDEIKNSKETTKILEELKEGKTYEEIGAIIGKTGATVSRRINQLIEWGVISEDAIKEARKIQASKREQRKEKVLELLQDKKTCREISRILGINESTVTTMRKELVKEGRYEYKRTAKREKIDIESIDEITDEIKKQELVLLQQGVTLITIRSVLGFKASCTAKDVEKMLIEEGKITYEDIKKAKEQRAEINKKNTLILLRQGYALREIAGKIPYATYHYVLRMVNKLIKEGLISREQIDRLKFENNVKENQNYVLNKLRQGLTQQEISDNDPNDFLSRENVKDIKRTLVEQGLITDKEINKAKKKRKPEKDKQRKVDNVEKYDERIYRFFSIGFSQIDISRIMGLNVQYIRSRKRVLILRGRLTDIRIKNAKKNFKKNAEDRKKRILKAIFDLGEEKDFDTSILKTHIEYCFGKMHLGKINEEDIDVIAQGMNAFPETIDSYGINVVIKSLIRLNKLAKAKGFINSLLVYFQESDSEMLKKLKTAKNEIQQFQKKLEAESMLRSSSIPISEVVRKTGLTLTQILEIKNSMSKTVEAKDRDELKNEQGDVTFYQQ